MGLSGSVFEVLLRTRELALFNLGIDSKLLACDLLKLRARDISRGDGWLRGYRGPTKDLDTAQFD